MLHNITGHYHHNQHGLSGTAPSSSDKRQTTKLKVNCFPRKEMVQNSCPHFL